MKIVSKGSTIIDFTKNPYEVIRYGDGGFKAIINNKSQGSYTFKDEKTGMNFLKENIHIVSEKSKADFIISNGRYWRGNPDARFAKIPDNFTIYKEIITDRVKIVSIFKREF